MITVQIITQWLLSTNQVRVIIIENKYRTLITQDRVTTDYLEIDDNH